MNNKKELFLLTHKMKKMKKYFLLLFLTITILTAKAQTYFNLDLVKLNKALAEQKISNFSFDSVTVYNGIIGSYKDASGNELIISFDSLSNFQKILKEDKKNITVYKKDTTNFVFFENDVITALYIELTSYKVTMALTSYLMSKESLEKIYMAINPEEILKTALIKQGIK